MSKNEKTYLDSSLERLNDDLHVKHEFQRGTRSRFLEKLNEMGPRRTKKSWIVQVGLPVIATLLFVSFASILLFSNQNINNQGNINNSLPDEFKLHFSPVELIEYEEIYEIEEDRFEYESTIYDMDGETVQLERYSQYEDGKYVGLRGIIRFQEQAFDMGIISTSRPRTSEEASMYGANISEEGEMVFLGTVGSWSDGNKLIFYDKEKNKFLGFHHFGEVDHYHSDKDGIDVLYLFTAGSGEAGEDIEVIRWNSGRLEIASLNETLDAITTKNHIRSYPLSSPYLVGVELETDSGMMQRVYGLDFTEVKFKVYTKIDNVPILAQIKWDNRIYNITGDMVNQSWIGEELGVLTRNAPGGKLADNGDVAIREHEFPELIGNNVHMIKKLDTDVAISVQIDDHYFYAFAVED